MTPLEELYPTLAARFWPKVEKTDGCWNWIAGKNAHGYGAIAAGQGKNKSMLRAHRVAWELTNGPIPEGLQLDHLCRNRAYVNPAHLEPVTQRENMLRGEGVTGTNSRKTHCKNGHSLSDALMHLKPGWRRCRECHRLAELARSRRSKNDNR